MVQAEADAGIAREQDGDFVQVQHLTRAFGDLTVVDNVEFAIGRGEFFSLLGPNGAGKSTTIRMLSTVLQPTSGDATIGGHSITHHPERVREIIGVCPQNLALYEELSAWDNLVFFGGMVGLSHTGSRDRAREVLELVGLSERAKSRVATYSGGMKRRLNIGIALMGHPQLLFLDEPTVGIDPQSRNNIFDTIRQLSDEGMTVLYTTHYMEEADHLSDRIAIMDEGRIISIGTPAELKAPFGDPASVTLEEVFLNLTGRRLRD
jgi:ABC-2 type transport system ATP-binding protein